VFQPVAKLTVPLTVACLLVKKPCICKGFDNLNIEGNEGNQKKEFTDLKFQISEYEDEYAGAVTLMLKYEHRFGVGISHEEAEVAEEERFYMNFWQPNA
jgi:hypothetical protein